MHIIVRFPFQAMKQVSERPEQVLSWVVQKLKKGKDSPKIIIYTR